MLHLFRDTADVDALRLMGDPDAAGEDAVPELAGLDREAGDRAAGPGRRHRPADLARRRVLPDPPRPALVLHHPVHHHLRPARPAAADHAARAYTTAIGELGNYYLGQAEEGHAAQVLPALRAEEANLLHALDLARADGLWHAAVGCLQGLCVLYQRTGRDSEWARLVAAITPDFTDPATGGPLPGREQHWGTVTHYRARLAQEARDWPAATTLLHALIAWYRDRAAAALAAPAASLTPVQRTQIRNLGATLTDLGNILLLQDDPGCLPHYQEALALDQKIGDRTAEAWTLAPSATLTCCARAKGPGPGRALVPAQPQPAPRQ